MWTDVKAVAAAMGLAVAAVLAAAPPAHADNCTQRCGSIMFPSYGGPTSYCQIECYRPDGSTCSATQYCYANGRCETSGNC
jgi:hypothetical protein